MTCDDIDELLSDLIDDELAEGARASVLAHVASCERCGASYRALKRTVRFVRANARVDIVPGTPGGEYQRFTRALVDDTFGKSGTEIFEKPIGELSSDTGGTS